MSDRVRRRAEQQFHLQGPILEAVFNGWHEIVDSLLSQFDSTWISRWPQFLARAIMTRDLKMAKLLIKHGIDVRTAFGYQALLLAVTIAYPDAVQLLLDSGMTRDNLNKRDNEGYTPLHIALINGDRKMVTLLVENGSDVLIRTSLQQQTTLHLAARGGCVATAKFILNCGIDINVTDNSKMTPLFLAVMYNRLEMIKFLIGEGANINAESNNELRKSPLSIALQYVFVDVAVVKYLMQKGAVLAEGTPMPNKIIEKICVYNSSVVEIGRLRTDCFYEKHNFYDILNTDEVTLAKIFKNKNILEAIWERNLQEDYPMFGEAVLEQINKGMNIRKTFDDAMESMTRLLPMLPVLVNEKICQYLDDHDLPNVTQAGEKRISCLCERFNSSLKL